MPGEDVLESFFGQDGERLAQAVEERERRRVGEVARRVRLEHVPEVEEHARALRLVTGGERLGARAHDPEPGGEHQPLLRSGDREVHLPVRSEEHTSELQSRLHLVCRLLLEKKKTCITKSTSALARLP